MAIDSQTPEISYDGSGVGGSSYPVPFRFDDSAWLYVELTNDEGIVTELELGDDYTITGDGPTSTANVVIPAEIPVSTTVRIYRLTPLAQAVELTVSASIPSSTLERALDRAIMGQQDLRRDINALGQLDISEAVGEVNASALAAANSAGTASLAAGEANTAAADAQIARSGAESALTEVNTLASSILPWLRSGCLLAWRATDVTKDGSNLVSLFTDVSGQGRDGSASGANRGTWQGDAVQLVGGSAGYTIADAPTIDFRSFTFLVIYRHQTGAPAGNLGMLYQVNDSGEPGLYMGDLGSFEYGNAAFGASAQYTPGIQFSPNAGLSFHSAAYSATGIEYGANGCFTTKPAAAAGSAVLARLFASSTGGSGCALPIAAVYLFSGTKTQAEIREIVSYHGADQAPGGPVIIMSGSSTVAGTGADNYATSLVPLAARIAGARFQSVGISGASFLTGFGNIENYTFNPAKGRRNIIVVAPFTNDLASNTGQVTPTTNAITAYCNDVRTSDPTCAIVFVTPIPRTGSITLPQTTGGYETDRQAVRTWMIANAATWDAEVCDIGGHAIIGLQATVANPTYYDVAGIHWTQTSINIGAEMLAVSCLRAGMRLLVVSGASINNSVIGATTPTNGTFTNLNTTTATVTTNLQIGNNAAFQTSSRGGLTVPADGVWRLWNGAGTGFTRIAFGNTTSGFASLANGTTELRCEKADGSTRLSFAMSGVRYAEPVTLTAGTHALTSDHKTVLGDVTSGTVTLQLPALASNLGRRFEIKKLDATATANVLLLDPNGSEQINGSSAGFGMSIHLQFVVIEATAAGWIIVFSGTSAH